MEYNVLHQDWADAESVWGKLGLETRKNIVVATIKEQAPDILILAERHDEWAGIGTDKTPTPVNLATELTDYAFAVDKIEGYVNRTPIVYNKSTFKCVNSGFEKIPEEHTFEKSQNKRVVAWAVLEDITETTVKGQRTIVFATHWTSWYLETYHPLESEAMQNIIRNVRAISGNEDLPVVVGGDFNVAEIGGTAAQYRYYTELCENLELIDADKAINPENYDKYIVDHIAIGGAIVTEFKKISVPNGSDHDPIVCEIIIGGKY